jgi:hypothetical protein
MLMGLVVLIGLGVCSLLGLVVSALISLGGFAWVGFLTVALVAHGIWEGFQKPKKPP